MDFQKHFGTETTQEKILMPRTVQADVDRLIDWYIANNKSTGVIPVAATRGDILKFAKERSDGTLLYRGRILTVTGKMK